MATPALILVAEDEESDAWLLQHAFTKAGLSNPVVIARDGQDAVAYLGGHSPYTDRSTHPLPALIVLDLKMPRMNGFDVLAWLKTRPDLAGVPVVILTSSSLESDIKQARQLGALDYMVKPHEFSNLVELVRNLGQRWLAGPGA
jgi:CheY-like chemotaxis protein